MAEIDWCSMCFILFKPDAFTPTKLRYILGKMRDFGITPIKKHYVKLDRETIYELWQDSHIINKVLGYLDNYLSGHELPLVMVEGEDIHKKLADFKMDVRSRFGCLGSLYNILHTPDDAEASERELSILQIKSRYHIVC